MVKKKNINEYINQLKDKKIRYDRIPYEVRTNEDFISAARKHKVRYPEARGYDIIENNFFVKEYVTDTIEPEYVGTSYFPTFEDYFNFLGGDIYDHSCYYQYVFTTKEISDYNLDIGRLGNTHFIDETIDDWETSHSNADDYYNAEKSKKQILKWIDRFIASKDSSEFLQTMDRFSRSKYFSYSYKDVIVDRFIETAPDRAFSILLDLCNQDALFCSKTLALRYGLQKVVDLYKPYTGASKQTHYKRRRELKDFVEKMSRNPKMVYRKGFSKDLHFFYIDSYYMFDERRYDYYIDRHFFIAFEDFANHLNNDLSDCDLSYAKLDIDYSKYVVNDKTLFPMENNNLNCIVIKKYNKSFEVAKRWIDQNGNIIDEKNASFRHFFDFVYFLKGDLSEADFLLCDGITNLNNLSGLNIKGCKFRSNFLEKFGIKYNTTALPDLKKFSFNLSTKNEDSTDLVLQYKHEIRLSLEEEKELNRLSYITDLHLMHRFIDCRSENDREAVIRKLANMLCSSHGTFLLVGGDVSSEFKYYTNLISNMDAINANFRHKKDLEYDNSIFILGNHELWDFPDKSLEEIISIYKTKLNKHRFYLLQNSIIYMQSDRKVFEIDEQKLSLLSAKQLREKLVKAQLIIFGGIAFSGLNESFNANNGIYRKTITRSQEIAESKKFEDLYHKVCEALYDKNVIIFTHTPKDDWTKDDYVENFVYVSGHTHKNYFFDDGCTRIYSDNQIGYKKKEPFLKRFYIGKEYDYFADYKDGIYEITKEQYNDFYRAKNIGMSFNRDGKIIMLKREYYYCFFFEGKTRLSMLNGGALVGVTNDIQYYYDNMLREIAFIKKPLDKYTSIQQKISSQIKAIGGWGIIHGAIIDINFRNHIYVNPNDLTITGYFAYDIISKLVYKNIPSLLKAQCPALFDNYKKLLTGKTENALVIDGNAEIDTTPDYYFETDIYRASRQIRKMQKVNKGILSTWYDPDTGNNLLE